MTFSGKVGKLGHTKTAIGQANGTLTDIKGNSTPLKACTLTKQGKPKDYKSHNTSTFEERYKANISSCSELKGGRRSGSKGKRNRYVDGQSNSLGRRNNLQDY